MTPCQHISHTCERIWQEEVLAPNCSPNDDDGTEMTTVMALWRGHLSRSSVLVYIFVLRLTDMDMNLTSLIERSKSTRIVYARDLLTLSKGNALLERMNLLNHLIPGELKRRQRGCLCWCQEKNAEME